MSVFRTLTIAAALLGVSPAFAQTPSPNAPSSKASSSTRELPFDQRDTVRITATTKSGRPTLMSYLGQHPLPETVDALIARLNEPDTCSKDAWPAPIRDKPCAIVAYYLMSSDETSWTPQLVFRAIYFVSHPDKPSDTAIRMINLDGNLQIYADDKVDEPLRPMRVQNSCKRTWDFNLNKEVKRCKKVNAHYVPFGILGYLENDQQQILTGKVKDAFFTVALSDDDIRKATGGLGADLP